MRNFPVIGSGVVGAQPPGTPLAVVASPVTVPVAAQLTAQQKTSTAIPAIVTSATESRSLMFQLVTIGAGDKYPFVAKGNYVYIEGYSFNSDDPASTGLPLAIKTDVQQTPTPFLGSRREFLFPETYSLVEVSNPNAVAVVLGVWLGFGAIRTDSPARDYRVRAQFVTAGGPTYAADQAVGINPIAFPLAISPYQQSAYIRKATLVKTSATLTAASFKLWLFGRKPAALADAAAVPFPPAGITSIFDYIGQLNFPTFITGGAGSTWAICDLDDAALALTAPAIDADSNGNSTLYGILTAQAGYVATAGETFNVKLHLSS